MAFTTALSGLAAATNNLSVTGNNIANANTTGFKRSRSEFADVYSRTFAGISSITPGNGVRVAAVAQQFNQGNLDVTTNNLDLAISGEGFFVLGEEVGNTNAQIYTRSGEFKLNKDGVVVNNQSNPLLVYSANDNGTFNTGVMSEITLGSQQGDPVATTEVNMKVNLNAGETSLATQVSTPVAEPARVAIGAGSDPTVAPAVANTVLVDTTAFTDFDPIDPSTYTSQSSVTSYDSLGVAHTQTSYFIMGEPVNGGREWAVFNYIDGNPVGVDTTTAATAPSTFVLGGGTTADHIGQTLVFDSLGQLTPIESGVLSLNNYSIPSAADLDIEMNYNTSTQFSSAFSVEDLSQDGLPTGDITGLDIDDTGVVFARFSNGASRALGKVALTRFPNPQGLSKLGDTAWGQSASSGEPIPGEAGANNFGIIQSGSLEASNVDLASQLVNLIIAQQTYQANSETISTENQVIQTILNIR